MQNSGRRRGFKSWFVEPYRQVQLGMMFVIVNVLFSILFFVVFGYYLWDVYISLSQYFTLSALEGSQTAGKFMVPAVVGCILIIFFIITTILVSVRYTHRIYGPLISINRYLDSLLTGSTPEPLKLRPSDQLHDLATKLNQIGESILTDGQQSAIMTICNHLDKVVDGSTNEHLELRTPSRLNELVSRINALITHLNEKERG